METPEKIYVTECMLFATNPEITLPKNDKIEYTRTDTFIEKACKYLKENATFTHPRKGTEECIINIPKFIEYMKGE